MKKLAVLGDFLEPHHHAQIDSTAARCGFAVDYYPDGHVPAELAGQYEVLYGMPDRAALRTFTGLKWFCGNFAGVDAYLDDALYPSPDVILTNSSGAYGVTIAEHLIMVTLMLLRHASAYVLEAAAHRWGPVLPMRSIMGSTITVVGTGDIGTAFAQRAKALGAAHIRGVHRTNKVLPRCFDESYAVEDLDFALAGADIVVLCVPGTKETEHLITRERLGLLKKTSVLINVGRGSVLDQDALMEVLNSGKIAGAALDVTNPEPLPPEHPLWNTKNLIITPHVSGNMSLDITCDIDVNMFCDNLTRYCRQQPLKHVVERSVGY